MTVARLLFCALLPGSVLYGFAKLTPETNAAFDRYAGAAEARMKASLRPEHFLQTTDPVVRANLRGGELRIESRGTLDNGKEVKVPDGMIQDCLGIMFVPGANIAQVKAVLQDYENYKQFYKPEVTESKQISHQGDEYGVFLKLYKKHVLTAVLNSNYHVRYGTLDAKRMYVTSHSTRIAEVKKEGELPIGNDSGFLWRLNSYWRFEEADGGVYAECEAISLSRDVPFGLGWMIKGFLEKLPKESMLNTLRGTKSAVLSRIR